jgi:hypothetical protein
VAHRAERNIRTTDATTGDRGNIVITQHPLPDGGPNGAIYLYTHSGGSWIALTVQCSLRRGSDRWDDEPYLGRIIFNELTAGAELETMSFGVSTYLTDNEHDLIVVDTATQTVSIQEPGGAVKSTFGFKEFAKLDLAARGLIPEPSPCATAAQSMIQPASRAFDIASASWKHWAAGFLGILLLLVVIGGVRRRSR